jgi:aspartyl-tRNA synthetase
MNVFANSQINTDEYIEIFNDNYDVNVLNKLKKQKFKNDYSNEIQSKINNRIIQLRSRDTRYSLKNQRTINKDWKDFNNNQ